jgi:hypothetical protein
MSPTGHFTVTALRLLEPEGHGSRVYIPKEQGSQDMLQLLSSLFVVSYDFQDYAGSI